MRGRGRGQNIVLFRNIYTWKKDNGSDSEEEAGEDVGTKILAKIDELGRRMDKVEKRQEEEAKEHGKMW